MRVLPENPLQAASTTGLDRTVMPDAAAEPEFTPPVPVHRALSNGLRVTVVEKKGLPIVSFALMVQAGAITDPVGLPGPGLIHHPTAAGRDRHSLQPGHCQRV